MNQEQSPETEGPDRKRRRKVLSCVDCRRRKVQCDRALPSCTRCTKAGKAASCVYEDDPPPTINGNVALNGNGNGSNSHLTSATSRQTSGPGTVTVSKEVWDDLLHRLLQQERTIERIRNERADLTVNGRPKSYTSSSNVDDLASPASMRAALKETMLFRGKAFKTQFYGPTDPRSSLAHIPGAFVLFRDTIARSPALVRCRRELETLRELQKTVEKSETRQASEDLLSHVPTRERTDTMIQLYLDNIDMIYGILHVPSFLRDYTAFWQSPKTSRPGFVVTILLMTACVECLMEETPRLYVADSPLPRERATETVRVCEAWLQEQSHKHTTLAFYQAHCLILIAKQINSIKLKRQWTESGNLLRLAVAAGMHRDSDLSHKQSSVFDKEMRKRIWNFIIEQDLQAAVDRGVPAVALDYISDCGSPLNLDDEDFDETTTSTPLSRPQAELTKMSYLRLSSQSRSLRSKLTTLLNQSHPQLTYEDVLEYTQQIEQCLGTLPDWTASDRPSDTIPASHEQGVALLRIQLEQFLLLLHAEAARQATTDIGASFSKAAFLSASRSIIRKLTALTATGRRFLLFHGWHIVRIFVATGHLATLPARSAAGVDSAEQFRLWFDITHAALALFEDRIMRAGNMQWSFSFAIYDLLRRQLPDSTATTTTTTTTQNETSGCDRIYNLCKHIIANQDPSFAMKAATHEDSQQPGATGTARSDSLPATAEGAQHADSVLADGNSQFVYGDNGTDLLDWNFDDWMLYNDAFWQQNLSSAPEQPLSG